MGIRGRAVHGWLIATVTLALVPACGVAADRALVGSMMLHAEAAYDHAGSPSLEDLVAPPALGIVGTVTAVDPGVGLWWAGASDRTEEPSILDVQDSDAQSITAHLVLKVDRVVFGTGSEQGDSVIAGVMVEQATTADVRGLLEGARLFVVLEPSGTGVWGYQPDVRGIALEGTFMARTGSEGVLDFFAFSEEMVAGLGLEDLSPSEIGELAGG